MVNPFYDELGRTMRRSTPLYKPSLLLLVKRIPQHYQVQFRGVTLGHRLGVSAPRSAPVFRTIRSSHLTSSFLHRGFSYDYATT